jgi:hypothetical protein
LERNNFAQTLATGSMWWDKNVPFTPVDSVPPPRAFDPARAVEEEGVSRAEDVVRVLLDQYVPGGIRAEARAKLVAFVADGKPSGLELNSRVREAVHAILTMPEFQLA